MKPTKEMKSDKPRIMRSIDEIAIRVKIDERLGKPVTAIAELAREMSVLMILKDKSDDEIERLANG